MNARTAWFITGTGRATGIDIARAALAARTATATCPPRSPTTPERQLTKES